MKKYVWGLVYGILLTAFTVYVLLDTFVIARVYTTVPQENEGRIEGEKSPGRDEEQNASLENESGEDASEKEEPEKTTPVITENSYEDGRISIVISEYREYDTAIYVAEVKLSSPEYLKTAFAKGVYGRNVTEKTSETAEANDAIFAVNGDYYGAQEKGYVLRNGVLYRDSVDKNQEDLVIYEDGSFVGFVGSIPVTANPLEIM